MDGCGVGTGGGVGVGAAGVGGGGVDVLASGGAAGVGAGDGAVWLMVGCVCIAGDVALGVGGYRDESPSWLSGNSCAVSSTVTGVPGAVGASSVVGAGDAAWYCRVEAKDAWVCWACKGG